MSTGTTLADFQMEGISAVAMDRLKVLVKYSIALGLSGFRCQAEKFKYT